MVKEPSLKGLEKLEELTHALRLRSETVSFAESCTGGLLSSMMSARAGVSDVYMGSIVAYANSVKENLLGVSASLLKSMGAVSVPVARQMALGVRKQIHTTWSLSITGIAGPGGGMPAKPVGTVCIGVAGPGVDRAEQYLFQGDRQEIQKASAEQAVKLLLNELAGSGLEKEK
jgi:PncC family amidohydrolase